MRWLSVALCVLMSGLIVVSGHSAADIPYPGMPQYANLMFGGFVTPTVAPGDDLQFSFNLTNPYDDPSGTMVGVNLTIGIYRYATQEESADVDEDFKNPPTFENGETEMPLELGAIQMGEIVRVSQTISTTKDTPHGSYFSQSTYFVRLKLDFRFEGNNTTVALQSRGYFTDEQWDTLVSFDPDKSIVNMTYLYELGIDGLIPDSSFGLKIPIPRWPLAVLIGACGFCGFMALYYFVLDNPGRYPSLEKRFYKLRGELRELWSKLKHTLRK